VIFWNAVSTNVELISWAVDIEGGFSKLSVCGGSGWEMCGLRIRQIRENLGIMADVLSLGMGRRRKDCREKWGCRAMGMVMGLLGCFRLWFWLHESKTRSYCCRARTG